VSERGDAQDVYTSVTKNRERFFPKELYSLFKEVLRVLEVEDGIYISDRKFIKIYNLIRARALLFHGGAVRLEDLSLLKYVGNQTEDFDILREKVPDLLRLG
jgi:MoxR-like ATPase